VSGVVGVGTVVFKTICLLVFAPSGCRVCRVFGGAPPGSAAGTHGGL